MRILVLLALLLVPTAATAEVAEVPIHTDVSLKPGETRTFTFESSKPLELGWKPTQAQPCTTNCVEVSDIESHSSFATKFGGRGTYKPVGGKITLTYANKSTQPVTITIYSVGRTCESESCAFVKGGEDGHAINIVVGLFKSITTSKDRSYSVVSGETITGRPFTATLLWWTDDPKSPVIINCSKTIQGYIDKKTPSEEYSPYILPGTLVGDIKDLVVTKFTGCVSKGTKYGMMESSAYK